MTIPTWTFISNQAWSWNHKVQLNVLAWTLCMPLESSDHEDCFLCTFHWDRRSCPRLSRCTYHNKPGFFLTPPAEKTKTQGQNSSKKLKEKTQPLGGLSLPCEKLKKKTQIHKKIHQNSKFSKGWLFLCHFYWQIFSKTEKFRKICNDIVKI